ncbi:MAG TPA: hypothetical protein VG890_05200 [Puia sp.]|nr:hypothetical protein [Puia sp.]
MKKISLIMIGLLLGFTPIAFAGDNGNVDYATLNSFKHDFKSATAVTWTTTSGCYKAEFSLGNQIMFAYYGKDDARLVAVTRFILSNQLPIHLQRGLREKLKDGWITDLFEVVTDGETYYYATVETDAARLVYRSTGFANWELASKTDK